MNIKFLGTGNAFCTENFNTSFMLELESKKLLIDAGEDTKRSLPAMGMSYKDITDVYISHLHGDHTSGLDYLAFNSMFDPTKEKINLYANHQVLDDLWEMLKWRLRSVPGKRVHLSDYFNLFPIPNNGYFYWAGNKIDLVQSVHIIDGFSIVPTYGLMINFNIINKKLYFTADMQFNPHQIMDFYKSADIIIQDCEYLYRGSLPILSSVHAHHAELKSLPEEVKKKMYLVHYQDVVLEKKKENFLQAKKDGFKGFIPHLSKYDILSFME